MPSLLRAALALSLLSTAVVGNPTATRVDGPVAIQARAGGNVLLNPLGGLIKPLEYVLTNGQRMARGLPPNKPHFRRADSDPSRPRPSGTPGGGCNPRNGVIRVTSPENAPGGRPSLDGFLSLVGNEFGEYGYTADRGNALRVILNDCDGTPFNLLSTNGFRDFPFVGGIKGFSSTSSNLSPGSYNYAYIGGTTQTAPNATPQNVPNAFSAATGIQENSESAIWRFRSGSDRFLDAQWVNTDGATPRNALVYVPSVNVFVLTGDVRLFEETFENVANSTFAFESV